MKIVLANDHHGIELKKKVFEYLNANNIRTSFDKKFSVSTLSRMLRNPKYKGYYCGKKTEIIDYMTKKIIKLSSSKWIQYKTDKIPPIIDETLWNKVNNKLNKTKERG